MTTTTTTAAARRYRCSIGIAFSSCSWHGARYVACPSRARPMLLFLTIKDLTRGGPLSHVTHALALPPAPSLVPRLFVDTRRSRRAELQPTPKASLLVYRSIVDPGQSLVSRRKEIYVRQREGNMGTSLDKNEQWIVRPKLSRQPA